MHGTLNDRNQPDDRLPKLRALGGARVSGTVASGWHAFSQLPQPARNDVWSVLGPLLSDAADAGNAGRFQAFCQRFGLEAKSTAPAIETLHRLLGYASAVDLPDADFRADLEALSADDTNPAIGAVLVNYGKAKAALRAGALRASIAEHGKLLTGIDWRVDEVASSNHGLDFKASVIMLTLHYREGQRSERITLQLLPDTMRELQEVCSRFVVE